MPRVMKGPGEEQDIRPYDFFAGFRIERTVDAEEPDEDKEEEEEEAEEKDVKAQYEELLEAEKKIIEETEEHAKKILSDAREQADILRQKAFAEGHEEGVEAGYKEAYEEQRRLLDQEIQKLQTDAADVMRSVSIEKTKLLEQYVDDLKKISLAIAEKIIQTSLQSSGDIVKRMILAATDKITKKQWAKIYITKCETGISMEVDAEFLDALSKLSDNIKIITMDNGEEGTCIIELPDEIIDASVSTQLENIKDILNNVRV
ncbi:MAG: hypothetical protein HFH15_10015 [Ruminococcus sp.]|nr:hypothetical protein [Ruminococcus sp.]